MNLKNFSLLYPTEAAQQAHFAGKDAPNIPMVVLDAYYEKAISFTKKDEPKSESEAAELTKEQMREMERLNKKAMKEVKKSAKIKEESK